MYRGREREDTTQFLYEINRKVSASERNMAQHKSKENTWEVTRKERQIRCKEAIIRLPGACNWRQQLRPEFSSTVSSKWKMAVNINQIQLKNRQPLFFESSLHAILFFTKDLRQYLFPLTERNSKRFSLLWKKVKRKNSVTCPKVIAPLYNAISKSLQRLTLLSDSRWKRKQSQFYTATWDFITSAFSGFFLYYRPGSTKSCLPVWPHFLLLFLWLPGLLCAPPACQAPSSGETFALALSSAWNPLTLHSKSILCIHVCIFKNVYCSQLCPCHCPRHWGYSSEQNRPKSLLLWSIGPGSWQLYQSGLSWPLV